MREALVVLGAFLVGSIPFSFLIGRGFGVDVRKVGSGNVGSTNVMREVGKTAGILAFVLDAGKGGAAVVLVHSVFSGDLLPPLGAAAAVLGHMFPPWLAFRGGKGVATGLGAFAPLAPMSAAAAVAAFVPVTVLTRYVSLGSLAGTATLVVSAFWLCPRPVALAALFSGTLIFWRHRGNLGRLVKGTERSLGGPS